MIEERTKECRGDPTWSPRRGRPHRAASTTIILGLALFSAAPAAADGTPDGQELAKQYCSACHRVAADQPPPPAVLVDTGSGPEEFQAPSFRIIATRAERTADELRGKIQAPHYPMREQKFLPEELEAIIAYILSLGPPGSEESDWPLP